MFALFVDLKSFKLNAFIITVWNALSDIGIETTALIGTLLWTYIIETTVSPGTLVNVAAA